MTALSQPAPVSISAYLEGELVSETKHEYLGGEIHAMAGASNRHNKVAGNVFVAFANGLRGKPCRPFNSDTKVRISWDGHTRFYYPDAMVVCRENDDDEQWQDFPAVIVEVLSDSTRRTDLIEKREAYFALRSLRMLIFVEPDQPSLTVHRRNDDGHFVREDYFGLEAVVPLPEIGTELPLAAVYEDLGG